MITKTPPLALVVDDARVVRKVARRILEELGFAVDEAENGLLALTHIRQQLPVFILLDWNMPEMDGIDFLEQLRSTTGLPFQPKVIFCTTENDLEHIQRAITAGADEYIMKPFDSDILRDKLTQIGLL
jgi:two-component system, chemotaxis family, chemotaxis protein CheY